VNKGFIALGAVQRESEIGSNRFTGCFTRLTEVADLAIDNNKYIFGKILWFLVGLFVARGCVFGLLLLMDFPTLYLVTVRSPIKEEDNMFGYHFGH